MARHGERERMASLSRNEVGVMPRERKQLLLETAAGEFAAAGYERASLNRIISSVGMSKSSFYHYVSSKEQLFDEVVDGMGAELASALRVPDPVEFGGGRFWSVTGELLQRLTDLSGRRPAFTDLGQMFYLPRASEQGAVRRATLAIDTWLAAVLRVGRDDGQVRTDLPLSLQADMVLALVRAVDAWTLRAGSAGSAAAPERLGDTDDDDAAVDPSALLPAELGVLRRLLAP